MCEEGGCVRREGAFSNRCKFQRDCAQVVHINNCLAHTIKVEP